MKTQKSSLARRNIQVFLSNKAAVIGGVIVLVMILLSVFAPLLTLVSAENPEWRGTAQNIIDTLGLGSVIENNVLSRKLNTHQQQLPETYGFSFFRRKINCQRLIIMQYAPQLQAA